MQTEFLEENYIKDPQYANRIQRRRLHKRIPYHDK